MQFRDAALVGHDTYFLSHRLRGQLGTERAGANGWPEGSYMVMMDGIPGQIDLPDACAAARSITGSDLPGRR